MHRQLAGWQRRLAPRQRSISALLAVSAACPSITGLAFLHYKLDPARLGCVCFAASALHPDPLVIVLQVMELMEGGDLRKALWQNKEEYAWENRGGQVLLYIPVTVTLP